MKVPNDLKHSTQVSKPQDHNAHKVAPTDINNKRHIRGAVMHLGLNLAKHVS